MNGKNRSRLDVKSEEKSRKKQGNNFSRNKRYKQK